MNAIRTALAVALAVACAVGIAWLSRVPTAHAEADEALLRLSWRVLGVRAEECRRRTEEELADLAPHMRTPEVCTGGIVDYELRVEVDDRPVVRDTLHPGGARRDRPLYVFRDLPIAPGRHEVEVTLRALVPEGFDRDVDQPLAYEWEGEVRADPAAITLITLDESGARLVLRTP